MFNRFVLLAISVACVCFLPAAASSQPAPQPSDDPADSNDASRLVDLEREVILRQFALGVATVRLVWAERRSAHVRSGHLGALANENYRKKLFERLMTLNEACFGSYQDVVDIAEANWKKARFAARAAGRNAREAELDLAVEEARLKLEGATLKRATFRLEQFRRRFKGRAAR